MREGAGLDDLSNMRGKHYEAVTEHSFIRDPRTEDILTSKGVEVLTYAGEEISLKGSGGPTCLTRSLLRV